MSDSLNIGFIGLGLIGGSIAKSLKRFHPQTRIFAYTRTEATLDLAVSERIVDVKCTKEDEAFAIIFSSAHRFMTTFLISNG